MNLLCSWIDTVTLLRKFNNDILVSVWVGPDGKNSDDFIVQFDQSDLLLPSIDYYKLGAKHPIIKASERTRYQFCVIQIMNSHCHNITDASFVECHVSSHDSQFYE